MEIDFQIAKVVLGTIATWGGMLWGVVRHFSNRMTDIERDAQERDAGIMKSLNEVERHAVTRADFDRLGDRLSQDVRHIEAQNQSAHKDMNSRLDAIMTAVLNRNLTQDDRGDHR